MIVLMFGPPGSGKGVQSVAIAQKMSYVHVSTGDALRTAAQSDARISGLIGSGKLIDDNIVFGAIKIAMSDFKKPGYILDGFPRNIAQAKLLDDFLAEHNLAVDFFIKLSCSLETIWHRLQNRLICKSCACVKRPDDIVCAKCHGTEFLQRVDDTYDVVKQRYDIYNDETLPVEKFYNDKSNKVFVFDADNNIDDLTALIIKVLTNA